MSAGQASCGTSDRLAATVRVGPTLRQSNMANDNNINSMEVNSGSGANLNLEPEWTKTAVVVVATTSSKWLLFSFVDVDVDVVVVVAVAIAVVTVLCLQITLTVANLPNLAGIQARTRRQLTWIIVVFVIASLQTTTALAISGEDELGVGVEIVN